ncbi:MAG: hypothetical protein EAZ24_09320 [Burkholderiales bacterium]|nr:MAG: hypothetical protein EAZ24_09320 [Burkholderiales bacterium]TAG78344.1 MAG: hypothetical protein EAZ21_12970 [Betaproteobacteria bacterium]
MIIKHKSKLAFAILLLALGVAFLLMRFVFSADPSVWPKISAIGFMLWFAQAGYHYFRWSQLNEEPPVSKTAHLVKNIGIGVAIAGILGRWLL